MTKVPRVECIEVNYHPALSKLCHQVKNLYNRANFLIKSDPKALPQRSANGVGGYVMYPLRVSIECLRPIS